MGTQGKFGIVTNFTDIQCDYLDPGIHWIPVKFVTISNFLVFPELNIFENFGFLITYIYLKIYKNFKLNYKIKQKMKST